MARSIVFCTTMLLGLNQLVTGSTRYNPKSLSVDGTGYLLIDLPQPPAAPTDKFSYARVKIERVPSTLEKYNENTPRYDMKKIPSGLKRFYEDIEGELAWFKKDRTEPTAESETLLVLFGHIVNDRVAQFHEFEPEFQRVFGTSYGNFASAGRSVLGWLVAFGAAEILHSIPLHQYNIDYSNLDISIKYLVEKHLLSRVAYVVAYSPFLIKAPLPDGKTLLNYVMNKSAGSQMENLFRFFAEMPSFNLRTISALIPILPNGSGPNALSLLLAKVEEISVFIKTSNTIHKAPFLREKVVKNLRYALQLFLHSCVSDFRQIALRDRFTVAMLFIEAENYQALELLMMTFPDMLSDSANGESLVQIFIDNTSLLCADVVARLRPELITQVDSELHSPLVKSIINDNQDFFRLFLPYLTSNDPIAFLGSSIKMRPTAIAMIHGKVGFLRQMVHHFTENGIPLDIYADLEIVMDFLDNEFIKDKGDVLRKTNLITHYLWLYLIEELNLENDCPSHLNTPLKRSLLDFAVIDRNAEAANLLIKKFGAQIVNQRCNEGPCQGNCLRFYKNDFDMLKLLVDNGVDLNTPIVVTVENEGIDQPVIKSIAILTHLLIFYDSPIEYIKSLNFNQKALIEAVQYSRKIFHGPAAVIALDLLWERFQIRL